MSSLIAPVDRVRILPVYLDGLRDGSDGRLFIGIRDAGPDGEWGRRLNVMAHSRHPGDLRVASVGSRISRQMRLALTERLGEIAAIFRSGAVPLVAAARAASPLEGHLLRPDTVVWGPEGLRLSLWLATPAGAYPGACHLTVARGASTWQVELVKYYSAADRYRGIEGPLGARLGPAALAAAARMRPLLIGADLPF